MALATGRTPQRDDADGQQRALLAAVLAAPFDLELRRVYGDYLSTCGDSRGEYVQLCCDARDSHDDVRRRAALEARADELRRRDQRRWFAPLFQTPLYDFRRASRPPELELDAGLLGGLSCGLAQLLDSAEAVAEHHALRRVALSCGARLAELGSCSALAHVEQLCLDVTDAPPDALAAAFDGPLLRDRPLRVLELDCRTRSLDAVLDNLAQRPQLRDLERLCIRTAVGARGARAIARGFPRLVDLDLVAGAEAAATLATELAVAPRRLRINGSIGPTAAEALLTSGLLFRVVDLELDGSALGWRGMRALAGAAPELAQLERLALRGAQLEDEAASLAAIASHLRELQTLDLSQSDLTRASVRAITASELPALESLTLAGARLGGLVGLSRALERWTLPRLRELSLRDAEIDAEGAAALSASAKLGALRALDLSGVGLDDVGARALARGEGLRGVRQLDLSRNLLGESGTRALALSALFADLEQLDLSDTPLGDDGARALARSRTALSQLRSLRLQNNDFGPDAGAALLGSPHLARLRELSVATYGIGRRALDAAAFDAAAFDAVAFGAVALDAIAHSASLAQLERLRVGHVGDDAARRFVGAASTRATRLRTLDLGAVSDDCAQVLSHANGFEQLETLRLDGQISGGSCRALRQRFTPLVFWPSMPYH